VRTDTFSFGVLRPRRRLDRRRAALAGSMALKQFHDRVERTAGFDVRAVPDPDQLELLFGVGQNGYDVELVCTDKRNQRRPVE
jgi:hypothetical protein